MNAFDEVIAFCKQNAKNLLRQLDNAKSLTAEERVATEKLIQDFDLCMVEIADLKETTL
jgi:hypothetical protein